MTRRVPRCAGLLAMAVAATGVANAADAAIATGALPARVLDRTFLFGREQPSAPLPMREFTPPASASAPLHTIEGRITLSREALLGAMQIWRDDYGTSKAASEILRHLPGFDFEFVTSGDALIPVRRGSIESRHPQWEFVLEPGRLWTSPEDDGLTRAALPFSLEERNANCLHNGVMTFLFDATGRISRVAYQVSSETCAYLKLDLWGVLPARYRPAPIAQAGEIRAAYAREVAARLPTRPIEALAAAYPGANPAAFGSPEEVPREDMTTYGFVIDGVHYVGGCDTRAGPYPFCDVLDLPSYSLAKSLVAGLGSLALARDLPGLLDERIADWVPACKAAGGWDDVRFRDALDMATGHFDSTRYDEDEKSSAMLPFFIAEDHLTKIEFACRHFPRRARHAMGLSHDRHLFARHRARGIRETPARRQSRFLSRCGRRETLGATRAEPGAARDPPDARPRRAALHGLGPHPPSRRHRPHRRLARRTATAGHRRHPAVRRA